MDASPLLPTGAYLESCCIRSRTALLDTGTEGAKGNVLAMVPPLSQPLEPSSDPTDRSFPLCTLRFFPSAIEHTLLVRMWILAPGPLVSHPIPSRQQDVAPAASCQGITIMVNGEGSQCGNPALSPVPSMQWARDEFEGLFQLPAESVNRFLG